MKNINNNIIPQGEDIIDLIPNKMIERYSKSKRINYFKTVKISKTKTSINSISILCININGMNNKNIELQATVAEVKPTIIFLQETKRKNTSAAFVLSGYAIIEKHATGEIAKNGLLIAIHNSIKQNVIVERVDDFYIKITIMGESKDKITLINTYVPCNTENRASMLQQVQKELKNTTNVIMMGDFNTDKKDLLEILTKEGIKHATLPTFHKGSRMTDYTETNRIIDYTITNNKTLIESERYITDLFLSDHYAIKTIINWKTKTNKENNTMEVKREILKYDIKIRNKLRILDYKLLTHNDMSAQEQFTSFYDNIKEYLTSKNVITPRTDTMNPKRNREIEKLIKRRRESYSLIEVKELSKLIKKECQKVIRQNYNDWVKKGCTFLQENNTRDAWKWLKKQSKLNQQANTQTAIINPATNELISDPSKKAELMANHLANLAKKEVKNEQLMAVKMNENKIRIIIENNEWKHKTATKPVPEELKNEIKAELDAAIIWEEIRVILKKCRNNKAASKDLIPVEVYKVAIPDVKCKTNMSKAMLKLFNICLETGFTPTEWSENIVVMLHKKGDATNLDNYRGITLINTLSKIYCKILAERLSNVNREHKLIRPEQSGFIKGMIGVNTVSSVVEILERRKMCNMETWMCFVDIRKAYDLVPHEILFRKLQNKGLGTRFVQSIKSLYQETKLMVRTDGVISEPFNYNRGVRQGCPTSPLLFDIFIDDLLDYIEGIKVPKLDRLIPGFCFADDTLLLGENINDIQTKVNTLEKWCNENHMEINASKCGLMLISNTENEITVTLNNHNILRVNKYTYLGVELNDRLNFKQMAEHRLGAGIQTLNTIKPTLKNSKIPLIFKLLLIKSVLIPRICYGIEVFGHKYSNLNQIKRIINQSLKHATGRTNVCISAVMQEAGIMPIEAFAKYMQLKSIDTETGSYGQIHKEIYDNNENIIKKRGVNRTRMQETKFFIKRYHIEVTDKKNMKKQVKNLFTNKKAFNPQNRTNVLRSKFGCADGKKVLYQELNETNKQVCKFITSVRLNTVNNASYMVRRKLIDTSWINKCILCEKEEDDGYEHWLTECIHLKDKRQECLIELQEIFKCMDGDEGINNLISYTLKGNRKTKVPVSILEKYKININNFIKHMINERKVKIIQRIKEQKEQSYNLMNPPGELNNSRNNENNNEKKRSTQETTQSKKYKKTEKDNDDNSNQSENKI